MKRPIPPPSFADLRGTILAGEPERISRIFTLYLDGIAGEKYVSWDDLRYRQPPAGLTVAEWWFAIKTARGGSRRPISLSDVHGISFAYSLPDELLKLSDYVATHASGSIGSTEAVTNPATRNRYLVSSLMEEAITSSQLEGASTERSVAKEMIRSGRTPRDKSELMIFNNFRGMQEVGRLREQELTPEMICDLHRIVTEGTLVSEEAAGRFQRPDEERISVRDERDVLLHRPPDAHLIPERIQRLCDFANGKDDEGRYLPPVLRALSIHFMLGYEHPFEDGNGRTARILFYWSMLNQGYWLTEFLSVSRILRKAPAQYARSFLHTELDDNDLTYFFIYHLNIVHRSIEELYGYLGRKTAEVRDLKMRLASAANLFNSRQIALLQGAFTDADVSYTVQSHQTSHRTATETARSDLRGLEEMGLLRSMKSGKRLVFMPVPGLADAVEALSRHGIE